MADLFRSYLTLLGSIREGLEQLSTLARQKTEAVQKSDLMALDRVLNQEQALALTFRGLEQKRTSQLADMGLEKVPLSELPRYYPPEMQAEARQVMEALKNQYKIYQTSAEVARNTLECNLHEIEKILESVGSAPTAGPGYRPPQAELPQSMKTDFWA